jgi:hypothetical protein
MKINIRLFILPLIGILSCTNSEKREADSLKYYDLNGLIDQQLVWLIELNPKIQKTAVLNGIPESSSMRLDSVQWARELKIFRDADLNKSRLRQEYRIVEDLSEPTSNLKIRLYEAINKEMMEVEYLKIFYVEEEDDLRKLEASVREKNALFSSKKMLYMTFEDNGNGSIKIIHFKIEGQQKMILMDTVKFSLEVSL